MTHTEILEKAIHKAVDGGWKPSYFAEPVVAAIAFEDYKTRIRFGRISDGETMAVEEVIFNHDFAKALWGEELNLGQNEYHRNNITSYPLYEWQWKLTQMVIADDPIKYLGEHLDD